MRKFDVDTRAFEAALQQKIHRLKDNAKHEERRLAEVAADKMRATVPRKTGKTAESIHVEDTATGTEIRMGGASIFLEFGTSHMSPRPFARPVIAEARGQFRPPSWH